MVIPVVAKEEMIHRFIQSFHNPELPHPPIKYDIRYCLIDPIFGLSLERYFLCKSKCPTTMGTQNTTTMEVAIELLKSMSGGDMSDLETIEGSTKMQAVNVLWCGWWPRSYTSWYVKYLNISVLIYNRSRISFINSIVYCELSNRRWNPVCRVGKVS